MPWPRARAAPRRAVTTAWPSSSRSKTSGQMPQQRAWPSQRSASTVTRISRAPAEDDRRRIGRREVVDAAGVADGDLVLDVLGQVAEPLVGQRDRVGPRRVGVRVVALEHHVVLADDVEQAQAGVVLDERAEHVVLEQAADVGVEVELRLALLLAPLVGGVHVDVEARRPEALLVDDLLGPLEEVGHPADRALGQGDLQVREAHEVAAEEPVEQRAGLVGRRRVGHERERRHVGGRADEVRRRADVHRDARSRCRRTPGSTGSQKSVWIDGRPSLVGFSEKAIDLAAEGGGALDLGGGGRRVPQRDDHHRDEPAGDGRRRAPRG